MKGITDNEIQIEQRESTVKMRVLISLNRPKITLNCDMGESYGHWTVGADEQIMPWIDMANIACGFHASDPKVMAKTIALAKHYHVDVGAHPAYQDLQGFGRRSIPHTCAQITELVAYQVGALLGIAKLKNAKIKYVKPHGALYNDMIADKAIFEAIVEAVSLFGLPLMTLATPNNQIYLDIADKYDVPLLFEAFADRAYQTNGSLVPRNQTGAVYHNADDIFNQAMQLSNYGSVTTLSGETLQLEVDTLCVHGDNPTSIALIQRLSQALTQT